MINKNRLIKLTQRLIRINSQNPPGNETQIAEFIKEYLLRLGLETKIYEFKDKRPNVVAYFGKKNSRHSLLVTPHMDTVPAGKNWRFNPFSGKIYKNRIYGLGATDCKGNLAAGLEAINSLVEDRKNLNYNLIFAATADEESGSGLGLIPLLGKGILRPTQALVLDSDNFNIIIAQKGLIHIKVGLKGRRAHGAYPWRGINAIDIAVKILSELKRHKFIYRRSRYLRGPTLNIGTIRGGDKVNIVADWCEFELDLRFLPGMSAEAMLDEIRRIIKKYTHNYSLQISGIQRPYQIQKNHPLIDCLVKAMQKVRAKPVIKGSEGATVITFFQDKNIPAIATGFGSEGCAHSNNEYIKIDYLYKGAQALEEFLKNYTF